MTTDAANIDPRKVAEDALAYYASADPRTISRNDSMTGEKYSVLDAAAGLASALERILAETTDSQRGCCGAAVPGDMSAVDSIRASIQLGILAEDDGTVPEPGEEYSNPITPIVRSFTEEQIGWVSAWLAGDSFGRTTTSIEQRLRELGIAYRESVDDDGAPSFQLPSQHIERDEN